MELPNVGVSFGKWKRTAPRSRNAPGEDIEKSITNGGKSAAELMAERQKKADEAGADMLRQSYGQGGGDAAKKVEGGMRDGAAFAAKSIGSAIELAGSRAALSISKASIGGESSGNSGRISMENFAKAKTVGARSMQSNKSLSSPQGSDYNSPYSPAFANGGSMRVGGSGGTDSQMVQFKATPNEHITVETPAQRRAGNNQAPVVVPAPNVQIVNQIDPRGSIDAMRSRSGQRATTNNIKANAEEIRRILGPR